MAAAWMVRFIIILSCRTNCLVTDYIRSGDNWMLPYLKDLQTFRKNLRQFSVLITFTFLYQLFINGSVSWDMVLEIKYLSCTKKKVLFLLFILSFFGPNVNRTLDAVKCFHSSLCLCPASAITAYLWLVQHSKRHHTHLVCPRLTKIVVGGCVGVQSKW